MRTLFFTTSSSSVLIILGGYVACCGNTARVLALEDNSWNPVTEMGKSRRAHACAALGNHVYVLGGHYDQPSEVLIVEESGYTVTDGPNLPANVERYGQAITYDGFVFYIDSKGKVIKLKSDDSGWEEIADNSYDEGPTKAVVITYDHLFDNLG